MKIFFLIELLYNKAGTERIATDVANGLCETTGWDIKFIVVEKNTHTAFTLDKNVEVISLNGSLSAPLRAASALRKIIVREKPDYIINVAATMSRISVPASLMTGTKVITWEHFNLYAGSRMGYLWRLCSAAFSSKTVVLTIKDKMCYPKYLQRKVCTIYNFPTAMSGGPSGIESDIAIAVGRLTYQKGFDMLLKVWEKVKEGGCTWKLYIVGSGEDEKKLKEESVRLGIDNSVTFIANTPQIAEYYKKASLYLMTSRFEGLPLVLIEAKQKGLPCISFDCPNGPSEVIRNGVDGYVLKMGDCRGMSEAILKLTSQRDRLKQFGKEALDDVKKRFSKDEIIRQWRSMLSDN